MILTDIEYKTFLKIHIDFLFYVGKNSKIIAANMDYKEFANSDFTEKLKCRDFFLENKNILDDYIAANDDQLTANQLSILTGFKKTITSNFVIFKCLTKNAIFIDTKDNKFYAVKALRDRFDHFFDSFPVLVKTTILPFNDQIIYDGFIQSTGIYYGPGMKSSMNEDYRTAKKNNSILKTL